MFICLSNICCLKITFFFNQNGIAAFAEKGAKMPPFHLILWLLNYTCWHFLSHFSPFVNWSTKFVILTAAQSQNSKHQEEGRWEPRGAVRENLRSEDVSDPWGDRRTWGCDHQAGRAAPADPTYAQSCQASRTLAKDRTWRRKRPPVFFPSLLTLFCRWLQVS